MCEALSSLSLTVPLCKRQNIPGFHSSEAVLKAGFEDLKREEGGKKNTKNKKPLKAAFLGGKM